MRYLLRRAKTSSAKLSLETLERRDCPAAISISSATVIEGTSASTIAQFKVSLSAPIASPVTVDWKTADDTARAGVDYRAAMGTVRFAPGQTSRTISVAVFGDAVIEPNETFTILLSNPVGADLPPPPAAGRGTIVNDDIAQTAVPEITVSDVQLPERNSGRSDALFTVSLSAATSVPVTLSYTTADGSATASDRDYAPAASRLTFAPGETQKTVAVGVLGDVRIESDESFTLLLSNAVNATFAKMTGTATIFNDDVRPAPPPVVTVTGGTVVEGTAGDSRFIDFTVKLSGAASRSVTVTYETFTYETFIYDTFTGLARVADNDYRAAKGTLVFQPGEKEKTVKVGVVGDTKAEPDEVFSLLLTSATGATIARSAGSAVGTIVDDDTPPTISVADVSLIEGNSGTAPATFVITLSRSVAVPVTVKYTTLDGTATLADADYTFTEDVLTFAPGETQKTVSVGVLGDLKPEIDEAFSLVLSAPTNATIKNGNGTGVATIRNDDSGDIPGFQISVNYNANVSGDAGDRVRTAVGQAVVKWQQVITGDVPSHVNPFNGQLVDDIVLDVRMGLLGTGFPTGTDGATGPNTIANAGPFFGSAPGVNGQEAIRPSPRLPYWGTIGFDPANASADSVESLYTAALHEIGHALGFGGPLLFEPRVGFPNGLVPLPSNQANPVYIGNAAVQAYNAIFGRNAQNIPMESEGGGGTALVHWDDAAVPGELMNGFLTIAAPLSRITVGAMQDLGYQVNPNAADVYQRPSAIASRTIRRATTSFAQSPLSLAFALHQQLAEVKPFDGTSARNSPQRR